MTTIPVERELLEQVTIELEHDTDRYMLGRELRKLLSEQPQAGAGRADEREAFAEWYPLGCPGAGVTAKLSAQAGFRAGAAWQRTQPPARHDQANEVRRLRETLTTAANRLDRLTLEVPGGYWREQAAEWTAEARAALTHSPKGEEE